jgi:hypothetical protein
LNLVDLVDTVEKLDLGSPADQAGAGRFWNIEAIANCCDFLTTHVTSPYC